MAIPGRFIYPVDPTPAVPPVVPGVPDPVATVPGAPSPYVEQLRQFLSGGIGQPGYIAGLARRQRQKRPPRPRESFLAPAQGTTAPVAAPSAPASFLFGGGSPASPTTGPGFSTAGFLSRLLSR